MEGEVADIAQLFVVLIGMATALIMGGLRMAIEQLDKLPKLAKAMIVGALAIPIALLSGVMGVELPGDPTTWDGNVVNVILTWLTAMGARAATKAITKPKPT